MLRALHLINLPYEGIWLDQLEHLAGPVGWTGWLDRLAGPVGSTGWLEISHTKE